MMDEKKPPLKAITARYLERIICPAKHLQLKGRGENLIRMVKESKADGVVFLLLKFCDPHAFDYPYIKEMLEEENIPCMLLGYGSGASLRRAVADTFRNIYPDIIKTDQEYEKDAK